MVLAGGIMGNGYQCGMVWGAALAAGARAYQLLGPGPQAEAEALAASQKLVAAFRARHKSINCGDITEVEMQGSSRGRMLMQVAKFMFTKGGPLACFSMAAGFAKVAQREINTAYAEKPAATAPATAISCASVLVRKLGATDAQAVMAAGLAGGIGLSGGACGALGAAIWMLSLRNPQAPSAALSFPAAQAALERFLQSTDYEFECAKIVGRTFENVADHAAYVAGGGCAKVIEALAAA